MNYSGKGPYFGDKDGKNIHPDLVRLCGEMPVDYWNIPSGLAGDNPTKEQVEKDWAIRAQPQQQVQQQQPPPPQQIAVNLLIGIPTGVSHDFEWSRDFAVKFTTRMCPPNSALIFENRYGIAQARESIVNQFIQNPLATHLLFFDSDILPIELHGVNTLIADTISDPKKYIVSGLYYNSLYSGLNCWKNEQALKLQDLQQQYTDPVVEVDKVGMGYTIIRKDLFKVLTMEDRPLFYYKIHEGNVMQSEDFVFFDKLAKYGIKPYVDTRVTAQHIKRCKVGPDGGIQF